MHIDYEVHLPVSVPLDVTNSFGNIELPDYTGALSVSSKFGKLTTGSLSNLKDIGVEFGSATIKNISNIDATFKFSKYQTLIIFPGKIRSSWSFAMIQRSALIIA